MKLQPLMTTDFDNLNIKGFLGAYAKDIAPKLKIGQSCVLNLENINGPTNGSHWVYICNKKENFCYFDSYAVTPSETTKRKMIKRKRCIFNNTQVQRLEDSICCGHLCVYVAKMLEKGHSFSDVMFSFSLNTDENEKMIERWWGSFKK